MNKLSQIESIGVKFTELLQKAGIEDQQQLLEFCSHKQGREGLAQQTGINPKLLASWTTHADLARIHGVGQEYAELLEHCGIDSVQTLAQCIPGKLLMHIQRVNEQTNLVRQLPSLKQIESWQEQAQKLQAVIEW